jgi:hypothetical protein
MSTLALNANWQSRRVQYYVLTPKQLEEFNKKYASILSGEQYLNALHAYERKHGYRVEEPRIN